MKNLLFTIQFEEDTNFYSNQKLLRNIYKPRFKSKVK
jgi:hypothetical protein